jgi:hypothetical protein
MRALATRRGGTRWLVSLAAVVLIALVAVAPTGAEAAPNSLKVTDSNAVVTSSCEFTVTRFNPNNTGPATVTGRLTIKAAEIKPSFFAPRKIATIFVGCTISSVNDPTGLFHMEKLNNGSTAYKSRYVEIPFTESAYRVCVNAAYVLRDGTLGGTDGNCNPSL